MKIIRIASLLLIVMLLSAHFSGQSSFMKWSLISWKGEASYYHGRFNGRLTSNGDTFSNRLYTCANNFLPLGTSILVCNPQNGRQVIVKVNDRMHPRNHRLVDLSRQAAAALGLLDAGVGEVQIWVLGSGQPV